MRIGVCFRLQAMGVRLGEAAHPRYRGTLKIERLTEDASTRRSNLLKRYPFDNPHNALTSRSAAPFPAPSIRFNKKSRQNFSVNLT
jgi:hypothetical protein